MGFVMTAQEVLLEEFDIERCPECHCVTGDDTEFKDFSNKNIAICAQCSYEWWFECMREDIELKKRIIKYHREEN